MKAGIDLDIGRKTFASGLLPELIAALRRCVPGDLVAVTSSEASLGRDLEAWFRFSATRWSIRMSREGHTLGDPVRGGTCQHRHGSWHPVGAGDADLLVTPDIFTLAESFAAVRSAFERESEHRRRLATIFNCA
jgi:hypothetical protein